jgi:hypothetical protein
MQNWMELTENVSPVWAEADITIRLPGNRHAIIVYSTYVLLTTLREEYK